MCAATSALVVAGDISAMLWNGVIRMPRFSVYRCMYSSSSPSAAAADSPPSRGGEGVKRYSARAPSWVIDQGTDFAVSTARTDSV